MIILQRLSTARVNRFHCYCIRHAACNRLPGISMHCKRAEFVSNFACDVLLVIYATYSILGIILRIYRGWDFFSQALASN